MCKMHDGQIKVSGWGLLRHNESLPSPISICYFPVGGIYIDIPLTGETSMIPLEV